MRIVRGIRPVLCAEMGSVMRGKTAQVVRWIVKSHSAALCAEMGSVIQGRVAPTVLPIVWRGAGHVLRRNSVVLVEMIHVLPGDVSVMTSA